MGYAEELFLRQQVFIYLSLTLPGLVLQECMWYDFVSTLIYENNAVICSHLRKGPAFSVLCC